MQDDAPPPADDSEPTDGAADRDPAPQRDPAPDRGAPEPVTRDAHATGVPFMPDDPESAYALFQRGQQLVRRRHNAQAATVLERAARLEPGRGSILEALGRASFNAGHHDRALEAFGALLDVDPASHFGHFGLAQSLRKAGRPAEAITHLRLACAMVPSSGLYRGALARAEASLPPTDVEGA